MSIRVRNLVKRFGAQVALNELSFDVEPGQTVAVIGESGAGKSTLLRCLTGLLPFDGGSIDVDGVTLSPGDRDATAVLLGRVGFVFQAFELFPHLSVLENCVLAPIVVRGAARAVATARARELLQALNLADKGDEFPEELSGGQRQRVAIVRALCMEPRVLLYDEPTSALDDAHKDEVKKTLQRVKETGVTQVIVTHDRGLARDAAERVLVLQGGRVVEGTA